MHTSGENEGASIEDASEKNGARGERYNREAIGSRIEVVRHLRTIWKSTSANKERVEWSIPKSYFGSD